MALSLAALAAPRIQTRHNYLSFIGLKKQPFIIANTAQLKSGTLRIALTVNSHNVSLIPVSIPLANPQINRTNFHNWTDANWLHCGKTPPFFKNWLYHWIALV